MVNTAVTDTEKALYEIVSLKKGFAMFPTDIFACCFVYMQTDNYVPEN